MRQNHSNKQFFRRMVACGMACLFLLFSVGIMKSTHFCMGREASVAWFSSESEKCSCSLFEKEEDGGCCSDTREVVRLEEDFQHHLPTGLQFLPDLFLLAELYSPAEVIADTSHAGYSDLPEDAQPPPRTLYAMHCSLVLYDGGAVA